MPQPDGSMLTIASLIRPGWILRMPHDAHGPGIEEVRAGPPARHSGRPAEPRPAAHPPAPRHASVPPAGPAAAAHSANGGASPGQSPPGRSVPGQAAPTQAPPGQSAARQSAPAQSAPGPNGQRSGAGYPLERRRRRQARRRPPGRRVVAPPPDAASAEVALRLGEDEASARRLDAGLRCLARELRRQGRTPPTVFAAHIGADNLYLWVTPASHDVPAPWYAVGDGQVWRL